MIVARPEPAIARMRIVVLIPTYRRPTDLERCLRAIAAQRRFPDSVVVVHREDDRDSLAVLRSATARIPLTCVGVREPGVIAALNAGLAAAAGDLIAITDDDAAPRPDWLARIEEHFEAAPDVGGFGGRDYVHGIPPQMNCARVGLITWFGRQIGNHHLGTGGPRDVDMLKGVNMSFRHSAIGDVRFDERLRGSGAQVHNELAFSLAIRRKGWRLVYDPAIAVDHYPARRFDDDGRSRKSLLAVSNSAYNETLILLEHLPVVRRVVFLLWAFLIGPRDLPGMVQALRLALVRDSGWMKLPAVLHGRLMAVRSWVVAATRQRTTRA